MYKAKVAACSDIRTKHSTQSEGHVEFLNVKPCGTYRTARLLKVKNRSVTIFVYKVAVAFFKNLSFYRKTS